MILRRIYSSFSTFISKPTVIFILGGPCSGKGTQSQLINDRLGYKHLSAGELLREQRKRPQSKHRELIEQVIVAGKIVPSFITVSLLQTAMLKHTSYTLKFLIDGFPRNIQNLQQWNKKMGNKIVTPFIISLTCSEPTMIKRLKQRSAHSSRSDDNLQVMQKRFKTHEKETVPVIEWFKQTNRVIQLDSEGTVQQIFNNLKQKINQKIQNSIKK